MGKKQSRQNRGARTGGHDRGVTAEHKQPPTKATEPSDEPARRISEHVSHKKPHKFGHN
ncbi:hypothetical protein ACFVTY_07990 [Streptomyces sp. NPDC058067]|uniref:hypothetical protein n=1 Tax=Streptomyces sp. NPDC058067 TaxID=3346324 RepID=UPI0036E4CEE7